MQQGCEDHILPVGIGRLRAGGELDLGVGAVKVDIEPCEERVDVYKSDRAENGQR